jgi:4-hydroxy-3-polyprenylbenzoate decarboxylase
LTASQTRAYSGLRGWIHNVDRLGELKRVSGAHWDVEMGAITHILTEKSVGTAPPILFDDVPSYPRGYRTLYGQLSSIKRIALTLGRPLEHERKLDIVRRYHARIAGTETVAAGRRERWSDLRQRHRRRRRRRFKIPGAAAP